MIKRIILIIVCLVGIDGAINKSRQAQLNEARAYYQATKNLTATIKKFPQFNKSQIEGGQ